jgi:hypothetical protein
MSLDCIELQSGVCVCVCVLCNERPIKKNIAFVVVVVVVLKAKTKNVSFLFFI